MNTDLFNRFTNSLKHVSLLKAMAAIGLISAVFLFFTMSAVQWIALLGLGISASYFLLTLMDSFRKVSL